MIFILVIYQIAANQDKPSTNAPLFVTVKDKHLKSSNAGAPSKMRKKRCKLSINLIPFQSIICLLVNAKAEAKAERCFRNRFVKLLLNQKGLIYLNLTPFLQDFLTAFF